MDSKILGFIACLLCLADAQDPTVTITESDPMAKLSETGFNRGGLNGGLIEVKRDQDVTMSCYVENKQIDTLVRWQMEYVDSNGKMQVRKVSADTSVEDNTKYSIEKPTQFTWKLRIKSIQLPEQGNYTCFVFTTRQNRKEANMTVIVMVPPNLDPQQTSSDTSAVEGDTVDLRCNASGIPPPTIEWTRLGGALLPIGKEKHYEPKLTIYRIRPEDRGKYMCRVYNKIETIERTITLDVKFKPIVKPIKSKVYQAEGYVIELQCYVEANPLPTEEQLKWVKNQGSRVISTSSGRFKVQGIEGAFNRLTYELIINGVEEEDYGSYSCEIRNTQGTTRRSIELAKTNEPQPSEKLGRIIKGGSSVLTISMATLLSCLFAIMLSRL